jgi:flagellin
MRINTNVASLNTQRILGQSTDAAQKAMGRLSSGFRINRAADDAAGLGIANKLRNNIRSLKQASNNAMQANAMLQIAEGATQQIGGILDRMKELASQAASSTSGDRTQLDAEFSSLKSEIDRIVGTTKYQDSELINGTMGNTLDTDVTASTLLTHADVASVKVAGAEATTFALTYDNTTQVFTASWTDAGGVAQTENVEVAAGGAQTVNFGRAGLQVNLKETFDETAATITAATDDEVVVTAGASAASFLVSSSGDYSNSDLVKLNSAIDLTSGNGLGLGSTDLASLDNAQQALADIDSALETVNSALATIGGAQNRIDFATQATKATIENFSAAESTIRDADMAAEMSEFTRVQILQQAGTAMLAQANPAPQMVLKLLG